MALPLSPSLRTLRIKVFDISILPDITKKMNNSKTKFIKSTFYLKL
jgi:ribosome recycling factor